MNFIPKPYIGVSAATKLLKLREWIEQQPPTIPSYSKTAATPAQMQVGTLITNLASIGKSQIIVLSGSVLTLMTSLPPKSSRLGYTT